MGIGDLVKPKYGNTKGVFLGVIKNYGNPYEIWLDENSVRFINQSGIESVLSLEDMRHEISYETDWAIEAMALVDGYRRDPSISPNSELA